MTTADSREPDVQYDFGVNWRRYLEGSLSQERVALAKQSLVDFLGTPDLRGRSFVEIGCGSGLISYAAFLLGARENVNGTDSRNAFLFRKAAA
jgi:2-polyprenyl-6-hydroxyphenyl methylase/3-demethylubiquinone-9 3-methyltransferase